MEPGHEDREYAERAGTTLRKIIASMEPGHEDREYEHACLVPDQDCTPQWSPVMKTGNTSSTRRTRMGRRSSLNGARS